LDSLCGGLAKQLTELLGELLDGLSWVLTPRNKEKTLKKGSKTG
jgi:hypothetical protein